MDIKNLLVSFILAVLTMWAINYFFFGSKQGADTGQTQSFVAPTSAQEVKPLNTEVDFLDDERTAEEVQTIVETDHAIYHFSTDGGCLDKLSFKRLSGDETLTIETIFSPSEVDRENRCFLVGFPEKTPYYFQLIERTDDDAQTVLMYQVPYDGGTLSKTFTIYKQTYQIDVSLILQPNERTVKPAELRLFYPNPIMPELGTLESINALVGDEQGRIRKTARSSLDIRKGWLLPPVFGADSKYFVHAMVKDPESFVSRAYFKLYDQKMIMSILEGPSTTQTTTWKVSFYFGPKESSAMALVDSRLEQTLDYSGLLAPLAKLMLAFLIFLYGFLHNYGLAIIVLTLLIRLVMLPFTLKGETAIKQQADVRKKLEYIKQRYKDDPQRLAQEQQEFMRKHGLPGLAGCLPMLLQLPVFFVLASVIRGSIELYKAPFVFWITDLSAKDPYYVLPILTTICMMFSIRATDARQRLLSVGMAVTFGAFSSAFPAGLSLYFLISTAFGALQMILQQWKRK